MSSRILGPRTGARNSTHDCSIRQGFRPKTSARPVIGTIRVHRQTSAGRPNMYRDLSLRLALPQSLDPQPAVFEARRQVEGKRRRGLQRFCLLPRRDVQAFAAEVVEAGRLSGGVDRTRQTVQLPELWPRLMALSTVRAVKATKLVCAVPATFRPRSGLRGAQLRLNPNSQIEQSPTAYRSR
jgi:hypothetical protein